MEHDDQQGMDRRDLIKRGAIVGGALVWTAPLVQTIASPAFAASSPGGQEIPDCDTTTNKFYKFNKGSSNPESNMGNGDTCFPNGYAGAVKGAALPAGFSITITDDTVTLVLPAGTTLFSHVIKVGSGQADANKTADGCVLPGGQSVTTTTTATGQNVVIMETVPNGISHINLVLSVCS